MAGQDLTALAGRGPRAGRELRRARSRIGMVFQHFNLLSSRTVQDNVELPLGILGTSGKERSRKALELLDLVGLADKAKAYPAQLSGRSEAARRHRPRPRRRPQGAALRRGHQRPGPGDHPLDPALLRDLNRQLGLTVLLITHEMDVVKSICDSAALMEQGPHRRVRHGRDLLATPGSELAAALFPVGGEASGDDRTVVDVTFHGESATQPVISQLSRTYNIDISILGRRHRHRRRACRSAGCASNCPAATRTTSYRSASCANRGLQIDVVGDDEPAPVKEGRPVTWSEMQPLLEQACTETLVMVGWSTLIAVVGRASRSASCSSSPTRGGLLQNTVVNKVIGPGRERRPLDAVHHPHGRPDELHPLGHRARPSAARPRSCRSPSAASPFFARLVETAVREVDHGLVEAVQAMGGGTWTIVRKVLVPEALPSLIASTTTTVIALIGYSAMAGTVGGGGLGDLAVRYGYQRFETGLMWITVAVLAVVISLIQFAGDYAARALHGRGGRSGPSPRLRLLRAEEPAAADVGKVA
ncbi:hypothetical protein GCM10019016_138020 [Streptomyces prasinosporus]|uniref:ATP-binding cassette domain-containing protein n=1 Tax=Streptomyces prasinosporus TaxID=68256 RepID=A0ABP6UGD2_9ACTN